MQGWLEERVRIVQEGKDESNIRYWASRSYWERMIELEKSVRKPICVCTELDPNFREFIELLNANGVELENRTTVL